MKTDFEIAANASLKSINDIRKDLGIPSEFYCPHARFKAKISLQFLANMKKEKDGKLIVVTAITPTKFGEGKTTTSIGLSMGLNKIGKKSIVTLRQPSLGPVFGVKGGASSKRVIK